MRRKRVGQTQTAAAKIEHDIPPVYGASGYAHGHDGEPPELIAPRDTSGFGKRQLPERENANTDRLRWLLVHKHIDRVQYYAGERLQLDWQLSQIGGYSAMGAGALSKPTLVPSNLPDAKLDAIARLNAARAALDGTSWRLLELVALENIQPHQAGIRLWGHSRRGEAVKALDYALTRLAKHYGLAS